MSEMTLTELQEIAIRQQQQIEINQQLLLAKEKRLKLLKLEEQKNQQLSMLSSNFNGLSLQQQQQQQQPKLITNKSTLENANKLENLKQSVLGQELKIFKLKELRNQIIKHKLSNSNMNSELELIKSLFSKKERELCDAIKNVSELTKQIDQLRKIKSLSFNTNSANGGNQAVNLLSKTNNINACELEKLKQELQIRNKLNEQQAKKIMQQHELFNQKQLEVLTLDKRIEELQARISAKRHLNELVKMKSISPKQQQDDQQLLIKDIDQEQDACELPASLIAPLVEATSPNSTVNTNLSSTSPSKSTPTPTPTSTTTSTTAKFATKQEIANTYMNKYGSETFQRFQQNSIKILKQQLNTNKSEENVNQLNSSNEKCCAEPPQVNSSNLGFQIDNQIDSSSFTALPSHLKLEFDKIKYLPDMVKTIKKRHSISEVEGSGANCSTIPPIIFQKMLEKHHKNFLDQKVQQQKLNQIKETPTDTIGSPTSSTSNMNMTDLAKPEQSQANESVSEQEPMKQLENNEKLEEPIKTKPIIKPVNNSENNASLPNSKSSSNVKPNGVIYQNNTNTKRVNFDPHALLLDAAVEGELDLVIKCAQLVDDISEPNDEGITALHNSVCAGHFDIVKFLVEFGCDINYADNDGWTPLHCAASCNNLPMVKFLIQHGASVYATTVSDNETSIKKCEEDEEGFEQCYEYLLNAQKSLGEKSFNNGVVYALYTYDAENEDELSFKAGDELVILDKHEDDFENGEEHDGWWTAQLVNSNKQGLVPINYLGLYPRVKSTRSHQESTVC